MAKPHTALEHAEAKDHRREPVLLWWMLAVLLLALSAASAIQAWQTISQSRLDNALAREASGVAARLNEIVARAQAQFAIALDDDALRASLETWPGAPPPQAMAILARRLPQARSELFGPELTELLNVDLLRFGYGRAYALAAARGAAGASPAFAEGTPGRGFVLGLAAPIRSSERTLAYAYAMLPEPQLAALLDRSSAGAGRIEVRQGGDLPSEMLAVGRAPADSPLLAATAVEASIFSVVTRTPAVVEVGSWLSVLQGRPPSVLIAAATLLLVLGLLASWRGLGGMRHALAARVPVGVRAPLKKLGRRDAPPEQLMPNRIPPMPTVFAPRPAPRAAKPKMLGSAVPRHIFRAYDIRGVVGESVNVDIARLIGQAVGSEIRDRGLSECAVARDGRLSGPELLGALIEGLRATGCDVIDVGAVPTPVLYFATHHLNTGSGVMLTGSHNPKDYNGFKIVIGGETLAEQAIADLYARIVAGRFTEGRGKLARLDIADAYVERITGDVQVARPLKLVVDAGNGIAGELGPRVLSEIGCEVVPLYCEIDGDFPNHHPDPGDPANLRDLILAVARLDADLGIAFDGDGDRLGVVTRSGEIIYPDRLLMLFAIDVLARDPGATIIYDVKCTGHLNDLILRHGGSPLMWKTGHSLIKAKMRETGAALAGEMSGHFFFRERWFGFDDGIYAAARLAEIVSLADGTPQELFDTLPKGVSTPELKVPMAEGAHYAFIERFKSVASFVDAQVSNIDGIRADWPDGWGLVRASNTTPILVLRFDADSEAALERIQAQFRAQILALEPAMQLPF